MGRGRLQGADASRGAARGGSRGRDASAARENGIGRDAATSRGHVTEVAAAASAAALATSAAEARRDLERGRAACFASFDTKLLSAAGKEEGRADRARRMQELAAIVPLREADAKASARFSKEGHVCEAPGHSILAPEKTPAPNFRRLFRSMQTATPPTDQVHETYLSLCVQQVRAEYWAFFQYAVASAPMRGWRRQNCHAFRVEACRIGHAVQVDDVDGAPKAAVAKEYDVTIKRLWDLRRGHAEVSNLCDLLGHLCIWRENLFYTYGVKLSCGCNSTGLHTRENGCPTHKDAVVELYMRKLQSMLEYPDEEVAQHRERETMLFSLGYCKDLVSAATLLEGMSNGSGVDVNRSILGPICHPPSFHRTSAHYRVSLSKPGILNDRRDIRLRSEQQRVVDSLERPLEIIHGPPGTGKSTCIRAIVRDRIPCEDNAVTLILAVQNKAIDVLVQMFRPFVEHDPEKAVVGMFVVGSASNPRLGLDAAEFTHERLLSFMPNYVHALSEYEQCADSAVLKQCAKALSQARQEATATILGGVGLIFATTAELHKIILGTPYMDILGRIKSVVTDEAATVAEWQAAMLAGLPAVERIVCIGDANQLPPFTRLTDARATMGFFERAQCQLAQSGAPVPMLVRQFRMHPDIASLVSESFYDNRLITDEIEGSARMPLYTLGGIWIAGLYWLEYQNTPPTHKLHENLAGEMEILRISSAEKAKLVDGQRLEYEAMIYNSFVNATEVAHVREGLDLFQAYGLFSPGPQQKSVFVLTFYRQQLEFILRDLETSPELTAAISAGVLRVQTVDSSQGSEADIIILSGVRSNEERAVGFLSSVNGARRICVAMSRARETLIIIGDRRTLAHGGERQLAFSRLWSKTGHPLRSLRPMRSFSDLASSVSARNSRRDDIEAAGDLFFETSREDMLEAGKDLLTLSAEDNAAASAEDDFM